MVSAPMLPTRPPQRLAPAPEPPIAAAMTLQAMAKTSPLSVLVRIPPLGAEDVANTEAVLGEAAADAEHDGVSHCVRRKRQRTEEVRKRECDELKAKLKELQEELSSMRKKTKRDHNQSEQDDYVAVKSEATAMSLYLEHTSRELHQYIASVRCLMSHHLVNGIASPVHPYVHLQRSMEARRQTILELKPRQLLLGRQVIEQRTQFLDLTRPHVSNEWYISNTGDACGLHLFVDQLHGCHSVEKAMSIAAAYAPSYKVSKNQSLSYMTYHDDASPKADAMPNTQLIVVQATTDGPVVEANTLLFTHYDPQENVGIIVATYVDRDDMRPFDPEKRVRQNVTAVLAISASPVGVVVRHWIHIRTVFEPRLVEEAAFGSFARHCETHRGGDLVAYIRQHLDK